MESPFRTRILRINTLTGSYKGLWEELKVPTPLPPRRCYHSACVLENKLIVYGGQDIIEGVFNDLWVLNIDEYQDQRWYKIQGSGAFPGPLCRHTAVVYNSSIFIYGGNDGFNENSFLYTFNLNDSLWNKYSSGLPGVDSHTAVVFENKMIIFGGYQGGTLTNEVYLMNFDTFLWTSLSLSDKPRPRAYHQSVLYNKFMFIYGGSTDSCDYLEDMWKLSLETYKWEEITVKGDSPGTVSGHTCCVYGDLMLVFGGIKDMLKETNEMYSFDFLNDYWVLIQTETDIDDPVTAGEIGEKTKTKIKNKKTHEQDLMKSLSITQSKGSSKKTPRNEEILKKIYDGPPAPALGRIRGRVPHSRDGHSANLYKDYMIIFGGDRYQMAFNDVYFYTINEKVLKK